MIKYQYKQNGASDVYRKHKKKVECFFRNQWSKSFMPEVWDLTILKPISEETAIALTTPKS